MEVENLLGKLLFSVDDGLVGLVVVEVESSRWIKKEVDVLGNNVFGGEIDRICLRIGR